MAVFVSVGAAIKQGMSWAPTNKTGLVDSNGGVFSHVRTGSFVIEGDSMKRVVKIGTSLGVSISEVSLAVGLEWKTDASYAKGRATTSAW